MQLYMNGKSALERERRIVRTMYRKETLRELKGR